MQTTEIYKCERFLVEVPLCPGEALHAEMAALFICTAMPWAMDTMEKLLK